MGKRRYCCTTGAEKALRRELGFIASSGGAVERNLWAAVIWRAVVDFAEPPGGLREQTLLRVEAKEYLDSQSFVEHCHLVVDEDGDGEELADIIRRRLGIAPTDKHESYWQQDVKEATP